MLLHFLGFIFIRVHTMFSCSFLSHHLMLAMVVVDAVISPIYALMGRLGFSSISLLSTNRLMMK